MDERFFKEIRTMMHGCALGVGFPWEIFSTGGDANQSLNQTPFGRRLVPCCLSRAKSDGELVLWLGRIVPSAVEDGSSQRMMDSGGFFSYFRRRDFGSGEWIKAARKDYEAAGFFENLF